MVALTWHDGDILVSTTGSIDSDFVQYAKDMMLLEQPWYNWKSAVAASSGYTLMFECVHPNDPHIIPEEPGMYFLGWRENTWDSKIDAFGGTVQDHWKKFALGILRCKYAESFQTSISELVEMSKTVKHEGFVFYTEDGTSAKIKSPYYLFKKFLARCQNTNKLVRKDIKNNLDEEFYPIIDAIQSDINAFTSMEEQDRLTWIRKFLEK